MRVPVMEPPSQYFKKATAQDAHAVRSQSPEVKLRMRGTALLLLGMVVCELISLCVNGGGVCLQ